MAEVRFTVHGFHQAAATLRQLGPTFERRVYAPSLRSGAAVVRKQAKTKNYVFKDGRGVRPFDKARGRTTSRRLRSTIRSRAIKATYSGREYKSGRYAIFAGGPGARHAYLVEEGHGGPRPAKPHRYLQGAMISTRAAVLGAFVRKFRDLFPRAVGDAMSRGSAVAGTFARTVARRARRN